MSRFKDRDKGKERREKVYNYLIDQGMEPHHAAGIVGNLMRESYQALDPTAVNDTSGAFGIAQWLGTRKDNLMEFAKEKGTEPTDFETQLEFLAFEIENPQAGGWNPKQKEAFFNSKTVDDAAWMFQNKFERAAESRDDEAVQKRIKYARQVYLYHNDDAIYSKDEKGQVVNVNPEVATEEEKRMSPVIRDEFYEQQLGVPIGREDVQVNDAPEALQESRKAAEALLENQKKEEEFINKLKLNREAPTEATTQAPSNPQPKPINPNELTPTQNEFFGSFIPKGL
jgi:hypothetical protein